MTSPARGFLFDTVKDYYIILGVPRKASEAEIKRAYRRLAVSYHPDKNSDPQAEILFKEINEAYDTLGDPQKKNAYDQRMENPFADLLKQAEAPRHKDPAYRRKKTYPPGYKTERQRMLEFMAQYTPLTNQIIVWSFIVSILLLIDFVAPRRIKRDKILSAEATRTQMGKASTAWWRVRTEEGEEFDLPYGVSDHFPIGQHIEVHASLLLQIPFRVTSQTIAARVLKTIYGNYIFAPAALLFTSVIGLFFRKDTERSFTYGIIAAIVLFFTILIFVIQL